MSLDYKQKYVQLLSSFVKATDVSYRLGFEDGYRECENKTIQQQAQQAQQQQQQQQAQQQAQQSQIQQPEAQDQSGSLDQKIEELEAIVNKNEKISPEIKEAVIELSDIKKSLVISQNKDQKKILSSQKQLVNNLVKKWGKEIEGTKEDIKDIIFKEGIKIE